MFSRVVHLCARALDRPGYLMTLALLHLYDWIAGPLPETPADRIRAEKAETFPEGNFDDPTPPL
jgi:hypothetical protein